MKLMQKSVDKESKIAKKIPKKILIGLIAIIILSLIAFVVLQIKGIRGHIKSYVPAIPVIAHDMSTTPVISRGVPAFASSGDATGANDNTFDTNWESNGTPAWIAYDLSKVSIAQRSQVLLVWYNQTGKYDHTLINDEAYNMPGSYTIDINTAPGETAPPTSGWQTKVTVTGNHYHSRQHLIDMTGANWIRMNATVSDGSEGNFDIAINMDVYDAHRAIDDDFIDYGDSVTAAAMGQDSAAGTPSIADLIHAQLPNRFPIEENGGTGFLSSGDGVNNINQWLSLFPGKYVGISFGGNDSWSCPDSAATTVYTNDVTMVKAVLAAGKIPLIPHMIWSTHSDQQACAVAIDQKIDQIYREYPQVIKGPDLYTLFQGHAEYFSDGLHPNAAGSAVYRQAWAKVLIAAMYHNH